MKKYRPQILSVLAMGLGGTLTVGVLYMLSGHFLDLFPLWPGGLLAFLLPWWTGVTIGVVCFGPFKIYASRRAEKRE